MRKIFSKNTNNRGFTLIELLVATTVIAVLMAVVVTSFRQANKSARDSRRKADLQELRGIIENYRLENGTYPDFDSESGGYEVSNDGTFMESLPSEFRSKTYADPVNDETYFYRYRVVNQPGCSYELSVMTESGSGQACPPCGISSSDEYYCIAD